MDDSRTHDRASQNPRLSPISADDTPTLPRGADGWRLPEIQRDTPAATATPDMNTIPLSSAGRSPRHGVSRRKLLVGAGAGALGLGLLGSGAAAFLAHQQAANPAASASLYAQDAAKTGHLLRRAGFGPSPADLPKYLSLGVNGTLDRLLNFSHVANDALEARLKSLNLDFTKRDDLVRWFTLRMLYTQRPFEEKLTLFWHGVLTSSFTKIGG